MENKNIFQRSEYSKPSFWDQRFEETKGYFDWYINIKQLYYYLEISSVNKNSSILIIGCGNSRLNDDLKKKGFNNLFNLDISKICVKKMKDLSEKKNFISEWLIADATKLPFKKNSFDFCIEKGTIDALMCGEDKIIPKLIMDEMIRVTIKKVFLITHGGPEKRDFLFFDNNLKNVKYIKQPLSDEADLINCMRASNKDKTLKEVMKDPKCLLKAILEYKKSSKQKKTMKMEAFDLDLGVKDILDVIIQENDLKKEKNKNNTDEDLKKEKNKNNTDEDLKKENEKNNTDEDLKKEENKNNTDEDLKKEDEGIYNPLRQNYCYVYMISKKDI